MVSNVVVPLIEIQLPKPIEYGADRVLAADVRQLVLEHVERNNYSWQQMALASSYQIWALQGLWEQDVWDLRICTFMATVLGVNLRAVLAE